MVLRTYSFFPNVIFLVFFSLMPVFQLCAQAPLIYFDFDGYQNEEDGDYPPSEVNSAFIDVGEFLRGSDLTKLASPANDVFSARDFLPSIQSPSNDYFFEFTITPTDQNYMGLSSLEFEIERSPDGPKNFVVRSDLEGDFTVNVDDQIITTQTYSTNVSINLNAIYQGVDQALTFRLYGYNSNHEWGTIKIDNLEIYGEAFDATPPAMLTGFPAVSNIATNSFDITVKANEVGTAYFQVLEDGATTPTSQQVIDNADAILAITATDTEFSQNITGLYPSTTYDAYVVLADAEDNVSDVPLAIQDINMLNLDNIVVENGETESLTRDVTVNNDVQVNAGGELILEEDVALTINGDLINNGVFTDNGGTMLFSGSNVQQILGNGGIAANNITIANTTGVTNETTIDLSGQLKLRPDAQFDADGSSDDQVFTLLSTAARTAGIAAMENGATLAGEITMQRYIGTGPPGWKYFSVPIKNQKVTDLQDDMLIQGVDNSFPEAGPQLFTYDESAGTDDEGIDGWQGITSSTFEISNKGLRAYLYPREFKNGPLVLDFTGEPIIGNGADNTVASEGEVLEIPLSYTPSAFDGGGWNLVQNPYPCAIDWSQVTLSGDVLATYYVWNPSVQNYAVYTKGNPTGNNGADQHIAAGQSFFVKAETPGQSVTFRESDKAEPSNSVFLRKAKPKGQFKLRIAADDEAYEDELMINSFSEVAAGFDGRREAYELPAGWVNLGAMKHDSTNLCVYAAQQSSGLDTIPLKLIPYHFGGYTMHFEQYGEDGRYVLLDHHADSLVRPDVENAYQFDIIEDDSGTFVDRFELLQLGEVEMSAGTANGNVGDTVAIPINANGVKDVAAIDLSAEWDADKLSYCGIAARDLEIDTASVYLKSNGQLQINWSSDTNVPVTRVHNSVLFDLHFVIAQNADKAGITLSQNATRVTTINDLAFPVKLTNGGVEILNDALVNGKVVRPDGSTVSGVGIMAEGEKIHSNEKGSFEFAIAEDSTVNVFIPGRDGKETSAVNLLDLLSLRSHVSGTGGLVSPYKMIAADVDKSKAVEEADVKKLKAYLLRNEQGIDTVNENMYVLASSVSALSPFDYDTMKQVAYGDNAEVIFNQVVIGDVTELNITNDEQISLETVVSKSSGKVEVSWHLTDSVDLLGYQMELVYNDDKLDFTGASGEEGHDDIAAYEYKPGNVVVLWVTNDGKPVRLGKELLNAGFHIKGVGQINPEDVHIDTAPGKSLMVDKFLKPLGVREQHAVTGLNIISPFELNVYPNPAHEVVNFSFHLEKARNVKLSVVNLVGAKVFEANGDYDEGQHRLTWQMSSNEQGVVESGLYFVTLKKDGARRTMKFIVE